LREFADLLRGDLNGTECGAAERLVADESNRWGIRWRETADGMHCLADGACRHLVMWRSVLIARRDRYASWGKAQIIDAIDAKRPGQGHARGMVECRDERWQQKRKYGEPSGAPVVAISVMRSHGSA
jgi:hypothetical protein